jgi:hypothetical protein
MGKQQNKVSDSLRIVSFCLITVLLIFLFTSCETTKVTETKQPTTSKDTSFEKAGEQPVEPEYEPEKTAKFEVVSYRLIVEKNEYTGKKTIRVPFVIKNTSDKPIRLERPFEVQGVKNNTVIFEAKGYHEGPYPSWLKPSEVAYAQVSADAPEVNIEGVKLDFYIDASIEEKPPDERIEILDSNVEGDTYALKYRMLENLDSGYSPDAAGFVLFDKNKKVVAVVGFSITGPKRKGLIYTDSISKPDINSSAYLSFEGTFQIDSMFKGRGVDFSSFKVIRATRY